MSLAKNITELISLNGGRLRYAAAIEREWIRIGRRPVKMRKPKVSKVPVWSESEVRFLIENQYTMEFNELCRVLNRKPDGVREKLRRLHETGIITTRHHKGSVKPYSELDLQFLITNQHLSRGKIAKHLHRTVNSVMVKLSALRSAGRL